MMCRIYNHNYSERSLEEYVPSGVPTNHMRNSEETIKSLGDRLRNIHIGRELTSTSDRINVRYDKIKQKMSSKFGFTNPDESYKGQQNYKKTKKAENCVQEK